MAISKRLLQPRKFRKFANFPKISFSSSTAATSADFLGRNGGEIIARSLKSLGVDRVFGVPGTKLLPVLDFVRLANIDFVMARNEQGATFMAEGFASGCRPRRQPGVALVSSGPGFSNTLTPVYDAFYQNLPLLVFSSQVPTRLKGTNSFQDTEAVEMAKYCTKWSTDVRDVQSVPRIIQEAYQVSISGRPGPVFIDVPEDVLSTKLSAESAAELPKGDFAPKHLLNSEPSLELSGSLIAEVAEKINNSARPLLIIGNAPTLAGGAVDALRHLVAKTEIPYATTFLGWGTLSELQSNALHVFGTNGHVYANFAVQNADCVIVIGEGLDDYFVGGSPGDKEFAREAQKAGILGHGGVFHIKNNIPKNRVQWFQPTLSIDSDYESVFAELQKHLRGPSEGQKKWSEQCQKWKREVPMISNFNPRSTSKLKIEPVLTELNKQLDERRMKERLQVVTGVGNHQISAYQYLKLSRSQSVTSSWTYCTMGFGLPAAIGVQFACKDNLVLNIDGDGSFGMTAMELATAVDHSLPIKTLIVNNQGHGMMKQCQSESFQEWYKSAEIKSPRSWTKLAVALGAKAGTLDSWGNLSEAITWFLTTDGPVVMEVVVDRGSFLHPEVPWGKPLDHIIGEDGKQIPLPNVD